MRDLLGRMEAACTTATRCGAEARRLLGQSAALRNRQRRLRQARCGPNFHVLGSIERARDEGSVGLGVGVSGLVLFLKGDFDLSNADELRDILGGIALRHEHVVVDLTETTFIDSAIVYALVLQQRNGLRIALRGDGRARRVIDLMGIAGTFELQPPAAERHRQPTDQPL
jgi:anti-anti-sigma regulatory factor